MAEPGIWVGPAGPVGHPARRSRLSAVAAHRGGAASGALVGAKAGRASRFFGPYLLAVELASMLLLAGLVGAYHLGRHESRQRPRRRRASR